MLTFQEEATMDILKFKRDQYDANNNNITAVVMPYIIYIG